MDIIQTGEQLHLLEMGHAQHVHKVNIVIKLVILIVNLVLQERVTLVKATVDVSLVPTVHMVVGVAVVKHVLVIVV